MNLRREDNQKEPLFNCGDLITARTKFDRDQGYTIGIVLGHKETQHVRLLAKDKEPSGILYQHKYNVIWYTGSQTRHRKIVSRPEFVRRTEFGIHLDYIA